MSGKDLTGRLSDTSRFQDGAEQKIKDKHEFEKSLLTQKLVTVNGLSNARNIHDKRLDVKYKKEMEGKKEVKGKKVENSEMAIGKKKSEKILESKVHLQTEFGKKVISEQSISGKYLDKTHSKRQIGKGTKIRDTVNGTVKYKLRENQDENASVEGVRTSNDFMYQVFNRPQRFQKTSRSKYNEKASKGNQYKNPHKSSVKEGENVGAKKSTQLQNKKLQQRNMEQKFRAARNEQKSIVEIFQEGKQSLTKIAHKMKEIATKNATLIITIAAVLLLVIIVAVSISSCTVALSDGAGTYLGGLSPADDVEITGCESYFTEKEMNLQERIDNIETEYPDEDEYIINIAGIGHDAIKLMAFLSAVYESYTLAEVQGVLDGLFDELYSLTIREEVETRYRQELNEITGEYENVPYEYRILSVTLVKNDWDNIIAGKFPDTESREKYESYIDTGGAHQAFHNPFNSDWSSHVSSEFGWRIHPITGVEKFHNGIDIALPEGTKINSCSTGIVIQSYFSDSAGNYVVIEDESGYTCHYMHMQSRSVDVGDMVHFGDIIGSLGNTGNSTGPHLHLGIKDNHKEWLNPRFMVSAFIKE